MAEESGTAELKLFQADGLPFKTESCCPRHMAQVNPQVDTVQASCIDRADVLGIIKIEPGTHTADVHAPITVSQLFYSLYYCSYHTSQLFRA